MGVYILEHLIGDCILSEILTLVYLIINGNLDSTFVSNLSVLKRSCIQKDAKNSCLINSKSGFSHVTTLTWHKRLNFIYRHLKFTIFGDP